MKYFGSLMICLAATTLLAWQMPKCPKNMVKHLPKGELYWTHATKGKITALASRLESATEILHHLTVINEAENKTYQIYETRDKDVLTRMWNYEIFNIKIISPTEIEYSVEDAGSTMVYHVQWNENEKKYIQDSSRMID